MTMQGMFTFAPTGVIAKNSAIFAACLCLAVAMASPAGATDAGIIARTGSLADSPKPVKILTLSAPATVQTHTFPGYLKALYDVNLSFRVPGNLVDLPAIKGAVVDQGDLLARVDPRDYESAVKAAESQVTSLSEQLSSLQQARPEDIAMAQSAVDAAKATAENDKVNLDRTSNLYKQGVVPKSDLDQAVAKADVSSNVLEQAKQALQIAMVGAREEELKSAQANVDAAKARLKTAQDALHDTELRAPFHGVVSDRMVENHQNVLAGQTVLSMQDLKTFEVVVNVPEQLLILYPKESIIRKTRATATFDVIRDKKFPLTFKEFSTHVDAQAQTFAATFLLTPEDERYTFLPGMTVTVETNFDTGSPGDESSFAFPPQAVLATDDGKHYAWRLAKTDQEGVYKTERVMVTVGNFVDAGLLVTSGVKAGEKYAVTGAAYLKEGMLVSELEWEGK